MDHNYTIIDSVLATWLKKYGLTVYTQYKDEPVRSIPVIDNQGTKFELWIEPMVTPKQFKVTAHFEFGKEVWRLRKKETWSKMTDDLELEKILDQAYKIIESWIESLGHKRDWY